MHFAQGTGRHPALMTACGAREEIKPRHVPAKNTLLTMLDQRVEHPVPGKKLSRILFDP